MLITDKNELKKYATPYRLWQGIPGVEVTPGGRIFTVFYSGAHTETFGNYAMLLKSDDGGENFTEPIAVAYKKEGRCYDPVLWIDTFGRLWFTWAYASIKEDSGVYAVVCNEPDANELVFSKPFFIGKYVMMNKPTVLSNGTWLFPIAVWDSNFKFCGLPPEDYGFEKTDTGAFVYMCKDKNCEFERLGGAVLDEGRTCDEHMVVEKADGSLMMLIRAKYGIAVSHSQDGGLTWTKPVDSGIGGPGSRFFIRRLRSGRLLLINHYNFTGRNNLTALLSEDDGETWKYSLLLDSRERVSYPDAKETEDGYIYIVYDRERGSNKNSFADAQADAREILLAKITESDIIAGKLVDTGSYLKRIVSKLGKYEGDGEVVKILTDLILSGYDGNIAIEPHMGRGYDGYIEYGRRTMEIIDKIR